MFDTLDPSRCNALTRFGDLSKVLNGLDAAQAAGLHVKLNAIATRGAFEAELDALIRFAHGRGMDLSLIEEMPLGCDGRDRTENYLPLGMVEYDLSKRWTLTPAAHSTGGPARYLRVEESGGLVGLISPVSCNFCASCNRLRVSATRQLYPCMGNENAVDLKYAVRNAPDRLGAMIQIALARKPRGHTFNPENLTSQALSRHMSVLGG